MQNSKIIIKYQCATVLVYLLHASKVHDISILAYARRVGNSMLVRMDNDGNSH